MPSLVCVSAPAVAGWATRGLTLQLPPLPFSLGPQQVWTTALCEVAALAEKESLRTCSNRMRVQADRDVAELSTAACVAIDHLQKASRHLIYPLLASHLDRAIERSLNGGAPR